jgi:hypothetical protein
MYTFEFRDEKIVIDWRFYLFEEFTAIWKNDKTRNKDKANKMLYFIFLLCDISEKNPIRDISGAKREAEALFHAFRDRKKKFTDKEMSLLSPAVDLYIELNKKPEERLLHTLDDKAKELTDVLESTTPETVTNEDNGVITFVSNTKIITSSLSKLSKIRNTREKIIASIKNEAITNKVRGQITLSPLIKGLIKIS